MTRKRLLKGLVVVTVPWLVTGAAFLVAAQAKASPPRPASAAPSTTTSAPALTPTATVPVPRASGPGTVQILQLPSGDADGKTREVWVYRPAVPDSAGLPVVYLLHGTRATTAMSRASISPGCSTSSSPPGRRRL